jgi:hypothetical protein
MLEIGSFRSRNCAGITRRAFVQAAAAAPFGLGLLPASSRAAAAEASRRAKSVLLVWLTGGPSHIDTFDPKPNAPAQYGGPFAPIATQTSGVRFTEVLPRLAARSNLFAVIRSSLVAGGHDFSGLTASRSLAVDRRVMSPNFGSIVARQRGADRLPQFIAIFPPGKIPSAIQILNSAGQGGGNLGPAYDPFLLFCSAEGRTDVPSLKLIPGLTPERLADRQLLRENFDTVLRQMDSPSLEAWDRQFANAYTMLTAPDAQKAFDLSREPQAIRDAYGHTSFGQSLVLGRRLVEAGVPYVQVNWGSAVGGLEEGIGWDTHLNNFEQLANYLGPIFDRAFAALLDDLSGRGLLESTLVVALGEFGRTPLINQQGPYSGRDHWTRAGFSLWAGAGVQGGRIVGATDRIGADPVTEPITALMIGTTIVDLAGIDSQARAQLKVLEGGRVIHELF